MAYVSKKYIQVKESGFSQLEGMKNQYLMVADLYFWMKKPTHGTKKYFGPIIENEPALFKSMIMSQVVTICKI